MIPYADWVRIREYVEGALDALGDAYADAPREDVSAAIRDLLSLQTYCLQHLAEGEL